MVWLLATPAGRVVDRDLVAHTEAQAERAPWLRAAMDLGTRLGSAEPLLAGCFLAAAYGPEPVRSTSRLVFWSLGANQLAAETMKLAIGRPRPDGAPARRNSSFPSAHASAAGGLAWLVGRRHPRAALWVTLFAAWIAVSRVFLARHYPSDVFAGLLLGVGFAVGALAIAQRLAPERPPAPEEPWPSATT
jgi:undecaprenyl-diphosphatase